MWLRQGTQRKFYKRLKYERRLADTELDFGALLEEQLQQRIMQQPEYDWLYANTIDWPDDPTAGKVPLTEDEKELGVIAAGSLLEVFSGQEGFSFPVGSSPIFFL